ncbi:hypothetical protein BDK51DRAFT_37409 [Blyttiomyces helicus]|uniref:Uncharacterized protein n=1 Tax=Blyttiomyces helicus TaxID=388810 RepID=A0A4P9VYA5_9FUNG|nr:hypothetical protein BDK51DRAFT_37409 [Blyttiomyces helicus]|eukprot:RKO84749.1 hypothetical protein BDK51DRAFT_37409 [Blyttiomyces helicus]
MKVSSLLTAVAACVLLMGTAEVAAVPRMELERRQALTQGPAVAAAAATSAPASASSPPPPPATTVPPPTATTNPPPPTTTTTTSSTTTTTIPTTTTTVAPTTTTTSTTTTTVALTTTVPPPTTVSPTIALPTTIPPAVASASAAAAAAAAASASSAAAAAAASASLAAAATAKPTASLSMLTSTPAATATSSTSTSPSTSSLVDQHDSGGSSFPTGASVGIGVVAATLLVAGGAFWWIRRNRDSEASKDLVVDFNNPDSHGSLWRHGESPVGPAAPVTNIAQQGGRYAARSEPSSSVAGTTPRPPPNGWAQQQGSYDHSYPAAAPGTHQLFSFGAGAANAPAAPASAYGTTEAYYPTDEHIQHDQHVYTQEDYDAYYAHYYPEAENGQVLGEARSEGHNTFNSNGAY